MWIFRYRYIDYRWGGNRVENKVRFSIIIPMFNVEKNIERCIEPLLEMKINNFEIILVDDGSYDATRQICEKIAKSNNRCRYFYQKNQGVSQARNYGMCMAHGDYFIFVDADDFCLSEQLEEVLKRIQIPENGWCVFDYYYIEDGEKNYIQRPKNIEKYEGAIKCVYGGKTNCVWACIYEAKIIKKNKIEFDTELKIGEDWIFNIKYVSCCQNIQYYSLAFYNYVNNSNSVMNTIDFNKIYEYLKLYQMYSCLEEKEDFLQEGYYSIMRSLLGIILKFDFESRKKVYLCLKKDRTFSDMKKISIVGVKRKIIKYCLIHGLYRNKVLSNLIQLRL